MNETNHRKNYFLSKEKLLVFYTSPCAFRSAYKYHSWKKTLELMVFWFVSLRGWGKASHICDTRFHSERSQWKVAIAM